MVELCRNCGRARTIFVADAHRDDGNRSLRERMKS